MMRKIGSILLVCCLSLSAVLAQETASENGAVAPENHPANEAVQKAAALFQQGQAQPALAALIEIHEQHADLPPGEVMFSQLAFASNQVQAARQALELAALRHADDPEPWNMFGDLALRTGRTAEAGLMFGHARELAEAMPETHERRKRLLVNAIAGIASTCERRQQWKQAEQLLRQWIKLDAKNSIAWRRLAGVFFQTERYDLASKTLVRLGEFDDSQLPAGVSMGLMYEQARMHDKAVAAMQQAAAEGQQNADTQVAIARWALVSGEQKMLRAAVIRAQKLDSNGPGVQALQGMAHRFAGEYDKAIAVFGKMLQENPASFDAGNGLALSLLEQGNPDRLSQAVQHAQVNIKSYSDVRTARGRAAAATLAWALLQAGKTAEATKVVQALIQSGELSPEMSYISALVLNAQGNSEDAAKLLTAALDSPVAFPQQDAAQALLEQLGKQP